MRQARKTWREPTHVRFRRVFSTISVDERQENRGESSGIEVRNTNISSVRAPIPNARLA